MRCSYLEIILPYYYLHCLHQYKIKEKAWERYNKLHNN